MKRYWGISKGSILESFVYRGHFVFTLIGNVLYIVLIYFLWGAIYRNSGDSINGMSFNDTFMYLTLATAIYNLMMTWADWDMSRTMVSGNITQQLIKPTNYQMFKLFENFGAAVVNFILLFLPSLVLVVFVFQGRIAMGWNLLFFMISILIAYIINFSLDFMTGCLSFYTESIWGISMTKEVIVLLLSGAVIPLPFFPEAIRQIVEFLPFQAIYNIPLQILINNALEMGQILSYIAIQLTWAVVMSVAGSLFFHKASRVITVNGG